jgi:cytochrome P450
MVDTPIKTMTAKEPPLAPGLPLLGNTLTFLKQSVPIEVLQKNAKELGDVVHYRVASQDFYVVNHPDLVQEMLVKRLDEFRKVGAIPGRTDRGLLRFLPHGILTDDHDDWRPQRKLMQPIMHAKYISSYAETMSQMGEKLLHEWTKNPQRNLQEDMTEVTMWIIAESVLGMSIHQTPELQNIADVTQDIAVKDLTAPLPRWLTPKRERDAMLYNQKMTDLVNEIIARHRKDTQERKDLLSLLLNARDEDGNPMPDEYVRNNILTLFFAGHETTANTLTWALYYLSHHPQVLKTLQQEVDSVLQGRIPTLEDLPKLSYTLMVINETMRMQPVVSLIPRTVLNDTEIGGYQIKKYGMIFISPYLLHHDARYWSNPETFDPSRFAPEKEISHHRYAFLPFGGGPRVCIGNHFALMEAQILLAMFVNRYEWQITSSEVVPLRQITTSTRDGLLATVTAR